jgi:uncharacterized protein YcbK (DUF882 family)
MMRMQDEIRAARRRFLRRGVRLAALGVPLWAGAARAAAGATRSLSMLHLHTGERIEVAYAEGERYIDTSLDRLNHFLRDHYSGDVGVIDPRVFDQLHAVQRALGAERSYEIISGYRCPATNAHLRSTRGGGVAKQSLHMQGRAIDVRLSGVPLAELRDAALSLRAGGVGYYAKDQFVHLDTGRVRSW